MVPLRHERSNPVIMQRQSHLMTTELLARKKLLNVPTRIKVWLNTKKKTRDAVK